LKNNAASLLFLLLAACSSLAEPTATAIPTTHLTSLPTLTPLPASTVPPPTATADPVTDLVPVGQPAAEWKGIPIMPGAITGEGDEEAYVFTIKATPEQVQEYYQLELDKLGWQSFAQTDGNSSLMLTFTDNASATLTVNIISKGDEALILLAK
jgi:hypothetical protein